MEISWYIRICLYYLFVIPLDRFLILNIIITMLFFRRRDIPVHHSRLNDQERCVHACLFFAFIVLVITIVLFYFAATNKGPSDQRLYYYIGGSISLAFLLLIILCTICYVQRLYSGSLSSAHQHRIISGTDYDSSGYPNHHV